MTSITPSISVPAGYTLNDVTPDALCALGMRPYLMTDTLVGTIRQHFAARDQIKLPELKNLIWDQSPSSAIVIESVTRWKPDISGQRPAVVVKCNDFSVLPLGINDELQGWYSADGREFFETVMRGSHTLFCLGTEAGEVERLGYETVAELIQFGPKLREYLKLLKLKVAEFGQLHRLQEATGSYVLPVTIAYIYQECWVLEPNTPRLKRITLRAVLENTA